MSRVGRVTVAAGAALALGVAVPAGAASGDGTPQVVNREVVQAELDSSGAVDVARLFSQLSVVGTGTVRVADPVSSKGLRNLDGFGAPAVRDGKAQYTIRVDGTTSRRTVSEFTKSLPVRVAAAYTLDGRRVRAQDIVGRTGDVTATYTIENVSASPTTLTWKDGKGETHSETVDLVTPYVGQVRTTLPGSFTELETPAADVAADGRGGTILTYSMVLFEPIGRQTQTFTWSGHVKDGLVPPVTIQVLPVAPSEKPELNSGVVGYRDGAAQATELTAGAGVIDGHLLELQGGAGELLAGLTKLAEGAAELRDGLTDEIAPGAEALADGAGEAKAGSSALADGLATADTGAADLAEGIGKILAGVKALPDSLAADPDYQALVGALTSVQSAITTKLVPGIDALRTGVGTAKAGLQSISAGVTSGGTTIGALLTQLGADVVAAGADPTVLADLSTLSSALTTQSTTLLAGLTAVMAGLGSTTDMTASTVQGGLNLVKLGLDNAGCDLTDPTDAANPCGIKQVQGLVSAGIGQLVDTVSAQLSAALTQADEGASDLADGMTLLSDGAGELDAGLGQIADGAGELSDGLALAADGSRQLADGLEEAQAGDEQIVAGAGRLRSEGTSKLVEGGNDTAGENAKKYATLVALGAKVADGALPYGVPEGASGTAAYQLDLAGADTSSNDNATRAVVALLLLVAASAVSWTVRRRRFAAG